MAYTAKDHVFAICAYRESPYLEECVRSLERQDTLSSMILCTATPNAHIEGIAAAHHIPVYVNRGAHGIAEDWNFALSQANAPLVTLAHQDDVYDPGYLRETLKQIDRFDRPLICFTDYYEIHNGQKVFSDKNKNLKIKEFLLFPFRWAWAQKSRWMRRRMLSVSDAICCPSVTFVKPNLPETVFRPHFKSDLDWEAWERLSRLEGSFCYAHQPLMGHRIHAESTTTEVIGDHNGRSAEDLEMYMKFWPRPVAVLLNRLYAGAQKGNAV
ncbi:MAG: glycosyltransferase [Clostridia bacterium]|nr:glycosyltransferase [Clostridia bacterium]